MNTTASTKHGPPARLRPNTAHPAKATGFTVAELLVAIAIVAILASIAIPSFADLRKRNRLQTAAEQVTGMTILARQTALATNKTTYVVVRQQCLGVTQTATGCDCATPANGVCEIRTVNFDQVHADTASSITFSFSPSTGGSTAGNSVDLLDTEGTGISTNVNLLGFASNCASATLAKPLSGAQSC